MRSIITEILEEPGQIELVDHVCQIERYAWLSLSYDMSAVIDLDGKFEEVNRHWERVTGHTVDDLHETYLIEYIHFDDREQSLYEMQKLITADLGTTSFAFRFQCKDETYKRLNWNIIFSPEHNCYFCVVKDVTELDVESAMRYAYRDALTGLYNRLYLDDHLPQILEEAGEQDIPLSIAFIDLDGFKQVNDTFGHKAGDSLLIEVAQRLVGSLDKTARIIRLGGDEFLIVCAKNADRASMAACAGGIIDELRRPFPIAKEEKAQIGASMGISLFPDDGDQAEELIQKADEAMYHVKHRGKNSFAFHGDVTQTD
jgi:diguanylate cyclase (GGDEF)-like protein/PAS domain S-box-containing protein